VRRGGRWRSATLTAAVAWLAAGSSSAGHPAGSRGGDWSSGAAAAAARGVELRLPSSFVENGGRFDERVYFDLRGSGSLVFLTREGMTFVLAAPMPARNADADALDLVDGSAPGDAREWRRWAVRLDFVGARNPAPVPAGLAPGVVSYLGGPAAKAGLRTYSRVVYPDLWPGIDLLLDGAVGSLKYTFVVEPGADPSRIQLAWRGAEAVTLDPTGAMVVQTPLGELVDGRPVAWQEDAGERVAVSAAFRLASAESTRAVSAAALDVDADAGSPAGGFGFQVGSYDPSRPLVIDPEVFAYAGFLGGCCTDGATGVAVDGDGNAYITGSTQSPETTFPDGDGFGPVPGFFQSNLTISGFVVKVDPTGTTLLYATYIAQGLVIPLAIAVDSAGNAYVTGGGSAHESTFPDGDGIGALPSPDNTFNGAGAGVGIAAGDAFVLKIDPTGTSVVYAGFIGGEEGEFGSGIAVDALGNAYVTGPTESDQSTFPDGDGFGAVSGFDQTFNGDEDAFLVKIDASGTSLAYATYLGGAGADVGRSVAVDGAGNAYLCGEVQLPSAATFPDGDGFGAIAGFDSTHNGDIDAFVAKIDAAGTGVVYAGFVGGSGIDACTDIALDGDDRSYVTGVTTSTQTTFPDGDGLGALGGLDPTHNLGADAWVARVSAAGSALDWAGYVGGANNDFGRAIAVADDGSVFVGGITTSNQSTFPDGDGFGGAGGARGGPDTTINGQTDAYVAKLLTGGDLAWATYIGGGFDDSDSSFDLAVDPSGAVYAVGNTFSDESTFPDGGGLADLPGPDSTFNDTEDAFVVKIEERLVSIAVPVSRPALALFALLLLTTGLAVASRFGQQ
jgi:hypothetical protein